MNPLFGAIDQALSKSQWLIALDRDGTIVPYADRPEEAVVDEKLRSLLEDVSAAVGIDVAIISARSSAQLRGDFDGVGAILAGNYGMEVNFPDGKECILPAALDMVPMLKTARDELFERIDTHMGAILEDHGYSLCLHWHQVPPKKRDELHSVVKTTSEQFPGLIFKQMPTSYEVFPGFAWDKGNALEFIASNLNVGSDQRFYFFAGDTTSDTPAFEWIDKHGGISIRVGPDENLGAQHRLDSPEDLHAVLEYVAQRKRL